ncbi:MAG: DNA repair protein [Bacteroidia bacterium]|nr:DNA repair protein [Bacteroidia bacterium]
MAEHLPENERTQVLNSEDVVRIMREILMREEKIDQDTEHFWVIGLSDNDAMLFIELISMGDGKRVEVEPMDVFSVALQKRAVRIMLVHNQPDGQMHPSEIDKDTTDRLIQVGLIVDIPVVDHLIMTIDAHMSFEETGLMETLRQSKKYVPRYKEVDRIKAEATKIGEERGMKKGLEEGKAEGLKDGKIEVAKALLADKKYTTKQIAELTGLSEREVEELK